MIEVKKFDGTSYYLNPHLIECIESNPDTTVTLVNSKKIVLGSSVEDILKEIISYRRRIGISISDNETEGIEGDSI